MEEHLFRCDKVKCEDITEKDKKRIIDFTIRNYDPNLSPTARIKKTDAKAIKVTDENITVFLILESDKGKLNVKITENEDELILKRIINRKDSKEFTVYSTNSAQVSGERFAGSTDIVLIITYLFLFSVIIVYSLVQFWLPSASGSSSVYSSNITFFPLEFSIFYEGRLFLIVVLAGALGNLVHALRSFYWYLGDRELVMSWLAMYLLLPVIGALLGFIFYNTIRVGIFPQETIQQTTPFAFVAAISALVSLFSVWAAPKIQDIVQTVFTKAGERRESRPQVSDEDKTQNKLRREFNL